MVCSWIMAKCVAAWAIYLAHTLLVTKEIVFFEHVELEATKHGLSLHS